MENNRSVTEAMPGRGYLVVSVRAGEGAIPLEGALVTLRGGDATEGDAIASFITDRSGNTPRITLPAPPRINSESPNGGKPYASYSADISLDGYFTNLYTNIPIFDTITSVQTAYLIPLPEDGSDRSEEVLLFDARTGERLRGEGDE
ncbi:MAG: hypothetical protein IKK74_00810 [Clostridia bacterium]|nr:hypothetical protein [Clostridia bacterium]